MKSPNHCIQATPVCVLVCILAQVPGAPDADRSAKAHAIDSLPQPG